jgi:hypothetical protein
MAKFALFKMNSPNPFKEYEGDYMEMDKEFVKILNYGTMERPRAELVASIRLDKGFEVTKISG